MCQIITPPKQNSDLPFGQHGSHTSAKTESKRDPPFAWPGCFSVIGFHVQKTFE